jgi:NAD(P)H-nitrite reductase large subunit
VWLTNGKIYECHLIISAIGVVPNVQYLGKEFDSVRNQNDQHGVQTTSQNLLVKECNDIYAVGDCASIESTSKHWKQMRIWSQAKAQGRHAAMHMTDTADIHFNGGCFDFELFTHHTKFWGHHVVLLGQFNRVSVSVEVEAEGVVRRKSTGTCTTSTKDEASVVQVLVRRSEDEFVKIILENNRVVGAVLVGQDMEDAETFENLILNEIDVSGIDLLNNQLDLADYFD